MKIYNKIIYIPFFLILACNPAKRLNKSDDGENVLRAKFPFDPCREYAGPLNLLTLTDDLQIHVELSDCGEWGGHREALFIENSEGKLLARFVRDTITCNRLIEKNGFVVLDDKLRKTVLDTTVTLKIEDERLISNFLQRLLELYLKDEIHGNYGDRYEVKASDSSFNLIYWNSGNCSDTYYERVRNKLLGY